jgi:hypothetical protein
MMDLQHPECEARKGDVAMSQNRTAGHSQARPGFPWGALFGFAVVGFYIVFTMIAITRYPLKISPLDTYLSMLGNADLLPIQELLDQYILPAVKSDQPLPANPGGLARLQAGLQALSQPQPMAPQPLPVIATQFQERPISAG